MTRQEVVVLKKIILITLALLIILSSLVIAQRRLDYNGYLRSAKIYLNQTPKDYKKAAEMCEQAIQYYPDEPPIEAHYILGTIYAEKKLYELMADEFRYVIAICDTSTNKDVTDVCKDKEFIDKINTIRNSAWIQQYNDGVNALKRARSEDSLCQTMIDSLEKAECEAGAMEIYQYAAEYFRTATIVIPDSAQGWVNLGLIEYSIGSQDSAVKIYREAVKRSPDDVGLLSNMATIFFNSARYDSAVVYFDRLIDLGLAERSKADVFYNKSFALDALGETANAIEALDSVITITPDAPDAWYNRGAFKIKLATDNINEINRLQDSLEVDRAKYKPVIDSLNEEIKVIYRDAAEDFEKVLAFQPDNTDALDWLGRANFFLERWEEAREVYERIVELNPDNEDAWCELLVIYLKLNDKENIQRCKKHCTKF